MGFLVFTYAWELRKFGNLNNVRRGLTYKPQNVQKSGVRVLRSSNINDDNFILTDDDVFVNEDTINIKLIKNGDILVTAANGSSRLVGKHAIVNNLNSPTVHGGFMLILETKNPQFINSLMGNNWYARFINKYALGGNGAIGNLNKQDLENQYVLIPQLQEQEKIGTFFKHLDELITLHQRRYIILNHNSNCYNIYCTSLSLAT